MKARHTFVATGLVALLALAGVTAAIAADPAGDPPPKIAFLANGIVPADALAAGPIAGQLGAPVFTTPAETLSAEAAEGLDDHNPELVIVLGGPVAINDGVLAQVSSVTGLAIEDPDSRPDSGIVRAAGENRFATAQVVAQLLGDYDPAYLGVDLKAADADLLDGKDSTAFQPAGNYLGKTEKAADSNLLDGKDSTEFQPAGNYLEAGDSIDADTLDGLDGSAYFKADGSVALGDALTYSTPQVRTLLLGSRDMQSEAAVTFTAVGARGTGTEPLVASVELPDGAEITAVTGYFFDSTDSVNLVANLRRDTIGGGSTDSIGVLTGTSGSSGFQTSGPFTFGGEVVDADAYEYYVTVLPASGASWNDSLGFEGFLVTYEVTTEG